MPQMSVNLIFRETRGIRASTFTHTPSARERERERRGKIIISGKIKNIPKWNKDECCVGSQPAEYKRQSMKYIYGTGGKVNAKAAVPALTGATPGDQALSVLSSSRLSPHTHAFNKIPCYFPAPVMLLLLQIHSQVKHIDHEAMREREKCACFHKSES